MRILLVIDTLGAGGKERRFTELVRALSKSEDIELTVIIMSNDIHYIEIFGLGIEIIRLIRRTPKDISIFRQFRRIIETVRPDAVHCWESMTAIYLAPVCKLLKCPLINGMVTNVPLRQNIFNHHWRRARLTFPLSKIIVGNSQAGLNAYNAPRGRSVVIYNGFDFARLESIREAKLVRDELDIKTDYVVGMVASFGKQKDYPTYYRAAENILSKRQDITFLAIGSGTDSEESVSLIGDRQRRFFRFLGKKSEVESYINSMNVCILATFTEGISNSVMEYMALGKPVVATQGGGTEELIRSGETGFLVEPSNHLMLAGMIERLIDDEDLRKKMGDMGKERILAHFSMDRMVNDYINLYRQVCYN
jgi:glycosyltransferase involved in cell wall biosynthesis